MLVEMGKIMALDKDDCISDIEEGTCNDTDDCLVKHGENELCVSELGVNGRVPLGETAAPGIVATVLFCIGFIMLFITADYPNSEGLCH